MLKLTLSLLILLSITLKSNSEEATSGNLLPNAGTGQTNLQNSSGSIDGFNSTSNWTMSGTTYYPNEIEATGNGTVSANGSLSNITTEKQNGGQFTTTANSLDGGVRLNSTTEVQNCEWVGSAHQCGQAFSGGGQRDSYSTTVKILDEDGNVLAVVNQTRNNDAGYGNNALKYEDSVSYTGAGSNQFYWEWEGVDAGYTTYGTSLGGPNLLGAKLTMTYDNTVIEEETIEEIQEVIEQFEEWEQSFTEPVPIEEFIPMLIALEEFGIIPLEEEIVFEELTTTLEEEFEEVEILQVFGGPEIVEEEEEITEEKPTETAAVTEELMEEQPEQTESTTVATVQEEPKSKQPETDSVGVVDVQDVQTQVAVKIKAIDKQLAAVNIIVADTMEKQQIDISSYYKQYTDNRQLYDTNVYEDLRILEGYDIQIYENNNKFVAISMNDPVLKYQINLQRAQQNRILKEKELEVLRR